MADASPNIQELIDLLMQNDPTFKSTMISSAINNPGPAAWMNNPFRRPIVQGGIGMRAMMGEDPTDQQRLEDAFFQYPTRQYGKMPR